MGGPGNRATAIATMRYGSGSVGGRQRGMGCEVLLRAQVDREPDFLHLANALSALYPKQSEETVRRQDAFSGYEISSLV